MRACTPARTCVSRGELECRSQPGPCAAARSAGLFVAPARNTPPGQICTRTKAGRDTNQQPDMSTPCRCIELQYSNRRQIRRLLKDQDRFLSVATERQNRKDFADPTQHLWWGSCLDAYDHRWSRAWPSTAQRSSASYRSAKAPNLDPPIVDLQEAENAQRQGDISRHDRRTRQCGAIHTIPSDGSPAPINAPSSQLLSARNTKCCLLAPMSIVRRPGMVLGYGR